MGALHILEVSVALKEPFSFRVGFILNDRCHRALSSRLFFEASVACKGNCIVSITKQTKACVYFLLPVTPTSNKGLPVREQSLVSSPWPWHSGKEKGFKLEDLTHQTLWRGHGREVPEGIWYAGLSWLSLFLCKSSFALGSWAWQINCGDQVALLLRRKPPQGCSSRRLCHGLSPLTWHFSVLRHVLSVWPRLTWNFAAYPGCPWTGLLLQPSMQRLQARAAHLSPSCMVSVGTFGSLSSRILFRLTAAVLSQILASSTAAKRLPPVHPWHSG